MVKSKKNNSNSDNKEQKDYIKDLGKDMDVKESSRMGLGMIVIAIVLGFVGGFVVWGAFLGSMLLTDLLWHEGVDKWRSCLEAAGIASWWVPLLITTVGGLLIGLWTKYTGIMPESMHKVMTKVKRDGKYILKKPFALIIGYLMPLVFGGTVGPEAGVTGLMTHACSVVGGGLRRFGIKVKGIEEVSVSAGVAGIFGNPLFGLACASKSMSTKDIEDKDKKVDPYKYELKRGAKLVLYGIAAVASFFGAYAFSAISGGEFGFPRFEGAIPGSGTWWVVLLCLVLGYLGAVFYQGSAAIFKTIAKKMEDYKVLKPLLCGLILGTVAIFCPMVMFPGEEQLFDLQKEWQTWTVTLLFATGFLKCASASMCLNMGWDGGGIFPMVYSGAAIGYAISVVTGVDPSFTVAMTSAILVAGSLRSIPMSLALMLLAFPPNTVVFTLIASVLGCVLPIPGLKTIKRYEDEELAQEAALQDAKS